MAEKKKTKTTEEKKIELNKKVWEVPYNEDLLSQVLFVYTINERKGTSNAKGRGDVRGGGIKPWRQKGTGRARSGSIRSPLWVGGGVTFVPSNKNWSRKINKQMARKATCIMLSEQLRNKNIEFFNIGKKEIKDIRKDMLAKTGIKALIITDNNDVVMSLRNTDSVILVNSLKLNAKHLANTKKVFIDETVIDVLEKRLLNEKQ
jgi:large subunit ribosomal protein L4